MNCNLDKFKNKIEKHFTNWIKGAIENEGGEFHRVLETFYGKEKVEEEKYNLSKLIRENYANAELQDLPDTIWLQLENTDSLDIGVGDFLKINEIIGDKRDWRSIKNLFEKNQKVEASIIAHLPDETYHLVSGNTRLCVAKALNIKPKVIILEFPYFR